MALDLSALRELADRWREEAERLGLDLNRVGRSHYGPYPIHKGEHRNFSLNPERGSFTCFVCGEGGDAISLWIGGAGRRVRGDGPRVGENLKGKERKKWKMLASTRRQPIPWMT